MFNISSVTRVCEYVMRCGTPQLVSERVFSLTGCSSKKDNECPMQVTFAVLADYALISSENKISVLGIFDQINVPSFPYAIPQMYLVTSIEAEPSEIGRQFQLELLFWDPDGAQLFAHETPIMFQQPPQRGTRSTHNALIGLHGLRLNVEGTYSFIVRVNGEERRRTSMRANLIPQSGAQQT